MPIISNIGRNSFKVRLTIGIIYGLLIVGAITMLYPFFLMLSGSVKSTTDINNITPYPRFWFDDTVLFQKYAESKYSGLAGVEITWHSPIPIWNQITVPSDVDPQLLDDFFAWRDQCRHWRLGHIEARKLLAINGRLFRNHMKDIYDGDISRFARENGLPIKFWTELTTPPMDAFRWNDYNDPLLKAYWQFAQDRPIEDRTIINLDGYFWSRRLRPAYTDDIAEYNRAHGTNYTDYSQVLLTERAPTDNALARQDWEAYVRQDILLEFVHFDADLEGHYQRFLTKRFGDAINEYNKSHQTAYTGFDTVPMPTSLPARAIDIVDWTEFLKDPQACPLDGIRIAGPRQNFEAFVAERRGVPVETIAPLPLPLKAADWHDCMAHSGAIRWELTTRNYKQVFDYVFVQSRGIINTIIYCSLAVGLALLVNPLAAYALSRYKPPSTYTILLICMATMAFPAEVTMIPSFLLLKRFPLWPILAGGASFGVALWILVRWAGHLKENLRLLIAAGVGVAVGAFLIPLVMIGHHNITLLNSFAALVLPTMANGYSIFLLKGFFDSLPQELYEAAALDGASEWTKFWSLTMNLSKPILAVIALAAFTAAYSQFMMALIIIPDPDMWTLMVWIFQLQSKAHQAVIYASLVIGAVPTFVIFVLCQGIIMRGIVVPIEK